MPPAQCPECGRFLAKAFVLGLATEVADCPKCGTRLSAAMFPDALGQASSPAGPVEEPAAAATLRSDAVPAPVSVRPPDLDPGTVRDTGDDPLAAWDRDDDGRVLDLDRRRQARQPPPDAAILAGAGLLGAVVGAGIARRRGQGALLGLVAGTGAASVARQVWRLPD